MGTINFEAYLATLAENSSVIQFDDRLLMLDTSAADELQRIKLENLVGGWRDLRAPLLSAKAVGVKDPDLRAFGSSGGIMQYRFDIGDEVMIAYHIDHDIKVGSTCYTHIHWSTDGVDTQPVKWEIEYMVSPRNDITHAVFPSPTTISVEAASHGAAWEHIVTEDAVGFTAPEVDSLLLAHLTRVTNGATDNSDDVFGLFMDIHYEAQQYGTPSRAPDFYI